MEIPCLAASLQEAGWPVDPHKSEQLHVTILVLPISCLTAPLVPDPPTRLPNRLADSRPVGHQASLAVCRPDNLTQHPPPRTVNIPFAWLPHPAPSHIYWNQALTVSFPASHPLSDQHGYIPSVDSSLPGETDPFQPITSKWVRVRGCKALTGFTVAAVPRSARRTSAPDTGLTCQSPTDRPRRSWDCDLCPHCPGPRSSWRRYRSIR